MSRHSKWAQIKHKKAITDQKRGAVFTKLIRLVTIAARLGGGDPEKNFRLRLAIDKAREQNLPQSNIEHAIERATGHDTHEELAELLYEVIGPSNTAIMVKAVTDNRNRTNADIKHLVIKHNGSVGTKNSVAWMFSPVGELVVDITRTKLPEDECILIAIDAGAQDVETHEKKYYIYTAVIDIASTRQNLLAHNIPCESAQITYIPKNPIKITQTTARQQLDELLEALHDNDDVTEVYINAIRE